ncbi:MAG: phosphopantothenoylcysteine decarboxylase [Chthoniobacterales bacterium]
MKIIVTCGPASSPIDHVRKITNFATGEIGTLLCNALSQAGHEVTCFRGLGASFTALPPSAILRSFDTNESLLTLLEQWRGGADVVFHAAALSDFAVESVETDGAPVSKSTGKISSATKSLVVRLAPAPKILPLLHTLFPTAKIVGWKFEVDGTHESAISHGRRQIDSCHSAACVVNGPAYGPGFGFLEKERMLHLESKQVLATFCADWLKK